MEIEVHQIYALCTKGLRCSNPNCTFGTHCYLSGYISFRFDNLSVAYNLNYLPRGLNTPDLSISICYHLIQSAILFCPLAIQVLINGVATIADHLIAEAVAADAVN
jgi:hypothetical protein